jgi:GNAT superfamily N-acetyltransferase
LAGGLARRDVRCCNTAGEPAGYSMAITIRTMTGRDIPLGMALTDRAGWNQTEADWLRFLAMEPGGCFIAEWKGRPAGTTVTTVLGAVGWIAMVLVDEAVRRRGIGTQLVEHAVAHLRQRAIATLRLDATPLGRPVYEKLGFEPEYEVARWEGTPPAVTADAPVGLGPVTADQFPAIVELDRHVTGTDRQRLIRYLSGHLPGAAWVVAAGGKAAGYALLRPGSKAIQVGPSVALDPEVGTAVFEAALRSCAGRRVFVDIPVDNVPASRLVQWKGFALQRRWIRMRRGLPVPDHPAQLWASSGPENG